MQEFFDIDRWKIRLDNGQIIAHTDFHCLRPVDTATHILYVRHRRDSQIVARRKSDNQEQVLVIPSTPMSGINHATDGRFIVFAWPSTQDKPPPYDARDIIAAIFDAQANQWVVIAGRQYVPIGDTAKPNLLWICKTSNPNLSPNDPTGLPRSIHFPLPNVIEFTTLQQTVNAITYGRFQRTLDLVVGAMSEIQTMETATEVPTWL